MSAPAFKRTASYGEPVIRGMVGPLWRHVCGNITSVDILGGGRLGQPWEHECSGCRGRHREDWRPLHVYTGPLCDQCQGNGWVPISGKVDGAFCGYDTVTECTACAGTGMASEAQMGGVA